MKIVQGIIPCKDRFFLDKALAIVKTGMDELVAFTQGEDTFFKVAIELYNGGKQLSMIYLDAENIPVEKEQATAIGKLLTDTTKDYVGFAIFEFWPNSLHVYQLYLLPQYRGEGFLTQIYTNIEKQARLVHAPCISVCTEFTAAAKKFGFKTTYTMCRKNLTYENKDIK